MKSNSINLLPPKMEKSSNGILIIAIIIVAIIAVGVQVVFSVNWSHETKAIKGDFSVLAGEAERIRGTGFLKSDYDAYLRNVQIVERVKSEQPDWPHYLRAIVEPLPPEGKVIAVSLNEDGKVLMELNFKTYESSISYLKALESDEALKDIRVTTYMNRVDDSAPTAVSADGTTIEQVNPSFYIVQIELGLNNDKGAVSNAD